ncbi:MAG: PepSY domain-containing protein [Pseudomonadota bacterium]
MKRSLIAALVLGCATPAFADNHPSEEQLAKINAMLTDMQCEVDDDNIEKDGDGWELDDVICADGGQFDIVLDADLNVVEKRAE